MSDTHGTRRIARKFAELGERGELGLVAYVTVGDPSLEASERIVLAAAEAGADIIELGVPFSDSLAGGPVIQRASERALAAGTTLGGVLELAAGVRQASEVPLVIFSYFNPILQMGMARFAERARQTGVDGVLVTDMTLEESAEYRGAMQAQGLDTIFLATPTSTEERLKKIAEASSGFLSVISRPGVTGERGALPDDLPQVVRRVRSWTRLPIAVGFGISLPTHVSVLGGIADAAVVGSALVAEIEKADSVDAAVRAVASRVRLLKNAGRRGISRRATEVET